MTQLDNLYKGGARNFLIVNVAPIHRTPMYVNQPNVAQVKLATLDFDTQLSLGIKSFIASHNTSSAIAQNGGKPLGQVKILDSYALFNVLLDNASVLGYYNITGYCAQYVYGTPTRNTQLPGCLPTSSYFWLNSFHPLWTVHE